MKCEICQCDTYVVHINEKHQKVCTQCYQKGETNGTGLSLVTAEKTGFVVYKERVKAMVKGEGHE